MANFHHKINNDFVIPHDGQGKNFAVVAFFNGQKTALYLTNDFRIFRNHKTKVYKC